MNAIFESEINSTFKVPEHVRILRATTRQKKEKLLLRVHFKVNDGLTKKLDTTLKDGSKSTFNAGVVTIVERIRQKFLAATTPSTAENILSKRERKPTLKAPGILTLAVGNNRNHGGKREGAGSKPKFPLLKLFQSTDPCSNFADPCSNFAELAFENNNSNNHTNNNNNKVINNK